MRSLLTVVVGVLVFALVAVAGFFVWWFVYTADLPDAHQLARFAPAAPAVVSDPCLGGSSTAIPMSRMAKPLQDAIRAAEPERSFPMQISRSMFAMFCDTGSKQSQRSLKEMKSAARLHRLFSDEELFTIYANRAGFGEGIIGVQNAAQHFFHKDADSLSVPEAAFLAGLIRAPHFYAQHPDKALQRRNIVLEQMVAHGSLTAAEAKAAEAEPLPPK